MDVPQAPSAAAPPASTDPRDQFFDVAHIKADIKRKTVRGGAVTFSYQFIKQAVGVIMTAILARLILPSDTGLVGMVTVFTGVIQMFSDMGLSAATIRRGEINHQQVSTMFWINFAAGAILGTIAALCAPLFAMFYGESRLVGITLGVAFCFFFSGLAVQHKALLKRQMRFSTLATVDFITSMVGNITTVIAAMLLPAELRYWALVLNWIIQVPVDLIGIWIACPWRPGRPRWVEGVRSMLTFGSNFTIYRFVGYISRNIDNVLIGRFFGATELGLYTKAYGLLLLPIHQVNNPIATVAVPSLSRLADDPKRLRQAYQRIASSISIITMPIVACMIMTADWLIGVWLGKNWLGVAPIFQVLGFAGLVESFCYTVVWLFSVQDRMKEQVRWGFMSTGITVIAIVAGIPWGTIGIATSYAIGALFIRSPLLFWLAGRKGAVRVRDIYATLAPFAAVVAAVIGVLYVYRMLLPDINPLLGLVSSGAITVVVTFGILSLIPNGRAAIRDLKDMPAILLQRKKK